MSEHGRLANEAWEALFTAQSRLLREFRGQDAFAEVGMSEYDVLYTLSKQDGPVRMGELGCSVLLSQAGLSRLVDRLRAGLSVRIDGPGPESRRRFINLRARERGLILAAEDVERLVDASADGGYRVIEGALARIHLAARVDRRPPGYDAIG